MKSCLGLLLVMIVLVAVFGSGALIWYLSSSAEFSRKGATTAQPAPTAHSSNNKPPVAIPRAVMPVRDR